MQFKSKRNQFKMMNSAKDLDSESDITNALHIPMESYMKTAESISHASSDSKISAHHIYTTKRCPVCDEELFEDMNTCYGCLYDFSRASPYREQGNIGMEHIMSGGDVSCQDLSELTDFKAAGGLGGFRDTSSLTDISDTSSLTDAACSTHLADSKNSQACSSAQPKPNLHTNVLTSSEFLIHSEILDTKIRFSNQLRVGRLPSNDVVLHAHSVSRNHIRIFINKDEVLVEDCGATNEAKIHGRAIMDPVSVMVGDTIDVCGITFTRVS